MQQEEDTSKQRAFGPIAPQPTSAPAQEEDTSKQRAFGPIAPQLTPAPAQANISEDRIVARILAAIGHQGQPEGAAAPASAQPTQLSEEDQRLVSAFAGVHTSGRDVSILNREPVGPNLYFVEYSYTPAGGAHTESHALVYDNGTKTRVFGGH